MSIFKRAFTIAFLGLSVPAILLVPAPAVAQVIATVQNTEDLIDLRIAQLQQEIAAPGATAAEIAAGNQRIDELTALRSSLPTLASITDSQGNTLLLQTTYDYILAEVSPTSVDT